MKSAAPDSEFVLLKHWSTEKGIAYQTLRDAVARREFDVLFMGREDSRRPHVYVRRADMAEWLDRRIRKKRSTAPQIHAA